MRLLESVFAIFDAAGYAAEMADRFERDLKFYSKKKPRELEAALKNLKRYGQCLMEYENPRTISAGFIHTEGKGVLAVDTRQGGGGMAATRLYFYTHVVGKKIHLLAIGDKQSQPLDIKACHAYLREKGFDA